MRHLPGIDGLRAIAVLAVVAYHAGLPVPAGFVGVDVFFVISGYLITRLLADEVRATGRIDFMHFYARRARRILPAAVLVVGVTLALSPLLPSGRAEVAESAAAASVFGANLYFQAVTGGYWDASAETMPLLHLWSLSVEEQFYLLWPLLLIAVRRHTVAALATVAVVSLALFLWLSWTNPNAAFYLMPARAWELAAGGLVAVGNYQAAINRLRINSWAGLGLILLACFVPLPHVAAVALAVAGAALLIAGLHAGQSVRVLTLRPVVYIGLISYSLYLWHWPLLALDKALRVGDAPLTVRLALCAVAFVLAAMSYRYVETPFRRSRASPRRAVAVGLACVAALSCTAFAMASREPTVKPVIASAIASDRRCHPFGPGIVTTTQAPSCVPAERKVLLWGDSHAFAWEPVAESIANREGIAAAAFWESSCYPTIGVELPVGTARDNAYCAKFNADALAYLQANRADTLIVSAYWTRMFRDHPEQGRAGVEALIRAAAPSVERILVIGPTPTMRDDVKRCMALKENCDQPRAEFEAAAADSRRIMAELAKLPKVQILDPTDTLCDAETCPAVRDGEPMYWDIHHVTRPVAAAFAALVATPPTH